MKVLQFSTYNTETTPFEVFGAKNTSNGTYGIFTQKMIKNHQRIFNNNERIDIQIAVPKNTFTAEN
ncbi:hypothetical protein [Bartonella gabonensis]|uniref:hypothetical protein n=1 Tax=Bartonella gabonensis TaxID=2699889 RepID=UPI00158C079B|nr:hypothetical protein [Bartonella gabonensis]